MSQEARQKPLKIEVKRKKAADLVNNSSLPQQQKQQIHPQSVNDSSSESSGVHGWSNEVIEPAIKSMNFRTKRGTRMKELIKGKGRKDQFWERYQGYFGGDLNKEEDQDDQEDYEASSSGRDEFDSDFDLTDSYVGKRGRKKGTKIRKRGRKAAKVTQPRDTATRPARGKRSRKPKAIVEAPAATRDEEALDNPKDGFIEKPYVAEQEPQQP